MKTTYLLAVLVFLANNTQAFWPFKRSNSEKLIGLGKKTTEAHLKVADLALKAAEDTTKDEDARAGMRQRALEANTAAQSASLQTVKAAADRAHAAIRTARGEPSNLIS